MDIAVNLLDPYDGSGITAPGPGPDGTLVITVREAAPFVWSAATQGGPIGEGRTPWIAIDLAPLVRPEASGAYAVVDSAGGPRRFWIVPGMAGELLDALYRPLAP
jgi:hypothetical protein